MAAYFSILEVIYNADGSCVARNVLVWGMLYLFAEPRKAVNVAHHRNDAIVAQRASRVLAGLAHDGALLPHCALDNLTLFRGVWLAMEGTDPSIRKDVMILSDFLLD